MTTKEKTSVEDLKKIYFRTNDRPKSYTRCEEKVIAKHKFYRTDKGEFMAISKLYDMDTLEAYPLTGCHYRINGKKEEIPNTGIIKKEIEGDYVIIHLPHVAKSITLSKLPLYKEGEEDHLVTLKEECRNNEDV
jgi:hypothetical protein